MPVQYLTGTPFPDWDSITVGAAVGKQLTDTGKKARLFYMGDHWQGGDGWGGPRPDPLTTKVADGTAFMEKIRGLFTSSNVLAEVVDRHVSAVIGREPAWQFAPANTPDGAEEGPQPPVPGQEPAAPKADPLVAEIEAAIVEWMDCRNAHQYVLEAAADFATGGHGYIRLFVPPGLLEDDGNGGKKIPTGLTLEEALDLVYIERIDPTIGGTAWERSTMAEAAFVVWEETVQVNSSTQTRKHTELQYTELVGKKRMTHVRSWDLTQLVGDLTLDLGGQLLMHEMRGKALATEQLMQLQKGLNFALTAMGNNNANAGFMERIISNAQPPGTYVDDPKKPGQKMFQPSDKYPGGPGATVFLTGHPITDEAGNVTGYTNPTPHFREPSSPDPFKASLEEYRAAMYMETKQGHLLAQADGNLSGASRIHLRADFDISLRDTRVAAEDTYRWLLTVLAKLGALFTSTPKKYDSLRATVQANVNTGPLTDAERTAITDQFEKGLRSRESAMALLGVDDPDAEFLRITGEMPANPVSLEDLALLGITLLPEQVASLMQRAGLTVTPEQLAQLQAAHASAQQLRQATAAARDRLVNPSDGGPPADPNAPPAAAA